MAGWPLPLAGNIALSSRDGMAQKILNRKGNESWAWVFLPHTGCTGVQQALPPVSTQNTVSGQFLSPPFPFAWSVNPALWDPCVGAKADGRHMGPNACSAGWSWLGSDICWLGWGGAGKKIQVSFLSDVEMYCHWLLLGSSKPVRKKCFHWHKNTFYIHIYVCLLLGRLQKLVASVLPAPLSSEFYQWFKV